MVCPRTKTNRASKRGECVGETLGRISQQSPRASARPYQGTKHPRPPFPTKVRWHERSWLASIQLAQRSMPNRSITGRSSDLRTRGPGADPTGRRFPDRIGPVLFDGFRFRLPLRGSPGFSPEFPLFETLKVQGQPATAGQSIGFSLRVKHAAVGFVRSVTIRPICRFAN